jgi:hypothetical protein
MTLLSVPTPRSHVGAAIDVIDLTEARKIGGELIRTPRAGQQQTAERRRESEGSPSESASTRLVK